MNAIRTYFILGLFFIAGNSIAQNLSVVTLEDQFGEKIELNENTKWLIFSHSMDSNIWVRDALHFAEMTPAQMQQKGIIYVADVHRMPKLVTKWIAIPRMKDYGFPIGLDKEGTITQNWQREENTITVYQLDELKVVEVQFYLDLDSLQQFMNSL